MPFADELANLSRQHFADTQIGHHTQIWNALKAFERDVVALHEQHSSKADPGKGTDAGPVPDDES